MDCERLILDWNIKQLKSKKIIGITVRTSNGGKGPNRDIEALWSRFYEEGISTKIEHKVSDTVYAVYTQYEGDHTKPYSLIIGHEVSDGSLVPKGCVLYETVSSHYAHQPLEGAFPQSLFQAWSDVWRSSIERAFTTDIESYDSSFDITSGLSNGSNLYIAIK